MTVRITLALLLASLNAHATPTSKRSVVKFDGDQIDGDLMRPEGDLMSVRPKLRMPSLVRAPKSFEEAQRQTILSAADAVARHRAQ